MSTPVAQAVVALALAAILSTPAPQADTFSNVPPTLSGGDGKQERIKHPRSAKALQCTTKCVGTCIRGGGGAPGEGPLNVRRPLVVFKDGFRSRQYWWSARISATASRMGRMDPDAGQSNMPIPKFLKQLSWLQCMLYWDPRSSSSVRPPKAEFQRQQGHTRETAITLFQLSIRAWTSSLVCCLCSPVGD
uniref:Uncharacterized protein n=1 Tax=Saccharum hybrid cultivar R570 TaxID=131158 RepID=A0A059Q0I4_9POAL|nr:hypothetical protein SHCRBa_001_I10_R_120 [Saccharum hybrid cultivar R570]